MTIEPPIASGPRSPFVLLNLKFRCLHSVWFDARGRDLNNYHQSSLVGQIGMGFGIALSCDSNVRVLTPSINRST